MAPVFPKKAQNHLLRLLPMKTPEPSTRGTELESARMESNSLYFKQARFLCPIYERITREFLDYPILSV